MSFREPDESPQNFREAELVVFKDCKKGIGKLHEFLKRQENK